MRQILVNIVPQYGKWVYYPVCDSAKAFAAIAGTRTLTEPTLVQIKRLGYEIKASVGSINELVSTK